MIVLLCAFASAQVDDRQLLMDALLNEAVDGDLVPAEALYHELSKRMADDDPLRGDTLYWLGHVRWLQGLDTARVPLREGVRSGTCPTRCRDLLERIELEQAAVRTLPLRWTFDDATHGLFHPWRFQDRGTLRLTAEGTLTWRTQPDPRQPDRLVMALDGVGEVRSFTLKLQEVSRDAALQLVVTDTEGNRFGLREAWRVAAQRPETLSARPADLVPVDGQGRLDPTGLAEVWIVDITPQGDALRIAIDELHIR